MNDGESKRGPSTNGTEGNVDKRRRTVKAELMGGVWLSKEDVPQTPR